jgi:hypothetical protein
LKFKIFIILIFFNSFILFSEQKYDIVFVTCRLNFDLLEKKMSYDNELNNTIKFNSNINLMEQYDLNSDENIVRRAEIIFFGSLTLSAFASWIFMSLYNTLIYQETFGNLNRNQFLLLYFGAGTISISVSITDLIVRLKPKMKGVEIY